MPGVFYGQYMKLDIICCYFSLIRQKGFGVRGEFWGVCGARAGATQLSRTQGSHSVFYQVYLLCSLSRQLTCFACELINCLILYVVALLLGSMYIWSLLNQLNRS